MKVTDEVCTIAVYYWVGTYIWNYLYILCKNKHLQVTQNTLARELTTRFTDCDNARRLFSTNRKKFDTKLDEFTLYLQEKGLSDTKELIDQFRATMEKEPLIFEKSKLGLAFHSPTSKSADITDYIDLIPLHGIVEKLCRDFGVYTFQQLQTKFGEEMSAMSEKLADYCKESIVKDTLLACLRDENKLPQGAYRTLDSKKKQHTICWKHNINDLQQHITFLKSVSFLKWLIEDEWKAHFQLVFQKLDKDQELFDALAEQLMLTLGDFQHFRDHKFGDCEATKHDCLENDTGFVTTFYTAIKDLCGLSRNEKLTLAKAIKTWIIFSKLNHKVHHAFVNFKRHFAACKKRVRWHTVEDAFMPLIILLNERMQKNVKYLERIKFADEWLLEQNCIVAGVKRRMLQVFQGSLTKKECDMEALSLVKALDLIYIPDQKEIEHLVKTEPEFVAGDDCAEAAEHTEEAANYAEEEDEEEYDEEECGAQAANYAEEEDEKEYDDDY